MRVKSVKHQQTKMRIEFWLTVKCKNCAGELREKLNSINF